jgi:hypothetical protein
MLVGAPVAAAGQALPGERFRVRRFAAADRPEGLSLQESAPSSL